MSRLWILVILCTLVSGEEDNVLVEIKGLMFTPKPEENVTFTGEGSMIICIGDYLDSPSLDNNDCRFFNSYKPFNLNVSINGVFKGVTTLPKKTVQITLNFKVNSQNADGTTEWRKYTYTTTSPLELGNRFPLVEAGKNFDLEGDMFVDCLDKELRPFCSKPSEALGATAGKDKREIDSRTEVESTFPSPLLNYLLTGFLIVLILVLIFVKVVYPKCIRKSPENSAAARQML